MTEFFNNNAAAIITAISTLFVAILGYIYNLVSQHYKNKQDFKLKEIEYKNKLTQETYQKLFENKIQAYIKLDEILFNYKKKLIDIGYEDFVVINDEKIDTEITKESITIDLLHTLNTFCNENIFYISYDMDKLLKDLIIFLEGDEKSFDYYVKEESIHPYNIPKEELKNQKEFYKKYSSQIDNLIKIIEEEIKEIKLKIDFK